MGVSGLIDAGGAAWGQVLPEPDEPGKVALVMIHGIGDSRPMSVLASAHAAIRKRYPMATWARQHVLPLTTAETQAGPGRVAVHTERLRGEGQTIDLVEFYWAGVAGKIRLSRPIDALLKLLSLLKEFPLMAVSPATSLRLRLFAWSAGHHRPSLARGVVNWSDGVPH
jgi:hypothetical protein